MLNNMAVSVLHNSYTNKYTGINDIFPKNLIAFNNNEQLLNVYGGNNGR